MNARASATSREVRDGVVAALMIKTRVRSCKMIEEGGTGEGDEPPRRRTARASKWRSHQACSWLDI